MLTCNKCGAHWPDALEESWGTTTESEGYGPEPRCVKIVEDKRTGAGAVCRGTLRFEADQGELLPLRPINAVRNGR